MKSYSKLFLLHNYFAFQPKEKQYPTKDDIKLEKLSQLSESLNI
jgi:hypothetical protein